MSQREKDPQIKALYDEHRHVYSYSKLNTIDDCPYDAWLSYIKHDRGINSVYGVLGTCIHDVLERIVNNEATEKDLLPALEHDLSDLELLGIDFPKDFRGGTSIRDKWIADMTHFCTHYISPKGVFKTEQLLVLKLDKNRALIGYSDLIRFFKDNSVQVLDYKTSSQFNQKDIVHHGRQLVAYSLALEQMGYKVRNPGWIMLKYLQVSYTGKLRANSKSETEITKICNRSKLYDAIGSVVDARLSNIGVGEIESEILMADFKKTNSLDGFPYEIRNQFTIKPYFREYPITDELRQECLNYIDRVATTYEDLETHQEEAWPPLKITKENEFKCKFLCGHRNTCPALKEYKDRTIIHEPKCTYDDLF